MPKLLIADDDLDVRQFLRDELSDAGFSVVDVSNGADAIVAAAENRFDLFIVDMLMPGLDGIQTIKVLRKVAPGVPILGLTGYVGRGYMAQAAEYGVVCLHKPVAVADLLREVNDALTARVKR
jgi:CheY-like chemotaxis protein